MSRRWQLVLLPLIFVLVSSTLPPAAPLPPLRQQAAGPVGAPSFGINSHLATRYPDPTSMNIAAGAVSELGVGWVREDLHWHRVQPAPDVWDWTFSDAAMRELLKRDIKIVGVLGPAVGWATPYKGDTEHDVSFHAPDPDAFVEYARAVVKRYRRYISHWEIWNEPDNVLFWQPEPDPLAYARLLQRTSAAIKRIDPQAQVLIGGFNPFDTTFLREVADAGAWDSFDIIAIHPYVDPYTPEEGNIPAALDRIHALTYRLGEKPIWATEIGWASGPGDRVQAGYTDQQGQANLLVRSMLLLWLSGVERSFWYTLKDDPHNPYGLIAYGKGRTDFRITLRKPAFQALRTLNHELLDTHYTGRRDLFEFTTLIDFEAADNWQRPDQPNGSLAVSDTGVVRVRYNFSTSANDYLVFERARPVLLRGEPHALGVWVYGDGSDHDIKIWLRDAEGELLQYTLGIVGELGWRFISAPISGEVYGSNRISGEGNRRLDFPAHLVGLVIDDSHDAFIGSGSIYLDDVTAISGPEVHNLRFRRGQWALDILWSPPGMRINLDTRAHKGYLTTLDGTEQPLTPAGGRFSLDIGTEPVFLWHQR